MATTNSQRFKGARIGAGYFSHFQDEAWQRIPEVEITAFSNRNAARAREIPGKFGPKKCYADWREMFDAEKPDFVDVITPPSTQAEICAEAAQRGIHLICQKPLTQTLAESRAIVDNAAKAGVRFMVHENCRFQPWHRELRRQIAAGAVGDVFTLTFRSRMGDGWGENAYIQRQPCFRDYPKLLIYETGVHFIDTFRFLAGAPHLIIDSAGGAGYAALIQIAVPGGRIVNYGATAGPPEELDLYKVFWKQLRLQGSTMGSPEDFNAMIAFVERMRIKPVVDKVFSLAEGNRALQQMKSSPQFGKYVLAIE